MSTCEGRAALGECDKQGKFTVARSNTPDATHFACGVHMPQLVKWLLGKDFTAGVIVKVL